MSSAKNDMNQDDNYSQQSSLLAIDYGVGSTNTNTGSGTRHHESSTATSTTIQHKLDSEESLLSKDIQRTISQMNELISTKMAPASECTGRPQHALLVKRYREIVFDCGAEYGKTCASILRRREARELFHGAAAAAAAAGSGSYSDNETNQQLLRERNAIDSSMNSASSVVNQAASVRAELRSQGVNLRTITGTMTSIASRVPGLNTIIDKIHAIKPIIERFLHKPNINPIIIKNNEIK